MNHSFWTGVCSGFAIGGMIVCLILLPMIRDLNRRIDNLLDWEGEQGIDLARLENQQRLT